MESVARRRAGLARMPRIRVSLAGKCPRETDDRRFGPPIRFPSWPAKRHVLLPPAVTERVEVTGESPQVETEVARISGVLERKDMESLPFGAGGS